MGINEERSQKAGINEVDRLLQEAALLKDRLGQLERAADTQKYAELILANSPTVLFRRLAADEMKARKSEEKYRRIVETTAEGFMLMDLQLSIVDVNGAYCRMSAYSRDELMGKELVDLLTPEYRPFFMANRDDLFNRPHYEFECELKVANGSHVPVLIHGNVLCDDAGVNIGNMAFVTDMSGPKKALRLAGEVQKSLLPKAVPEIPGLDIAGKTISCDEIGGDYYDFLVSSQAPQRRLSVVVGDISGHGVDAALLMTTARAFLRMRAAQPGTLTDTITSMNRHLVEDVFETGKFMTLFYLTLDMRSRSIEWIRAGHEPAWLFDPQEDRFEELKGAGVALGVDETYRYGSTLRNHLKNLGVF